MQINGITLHWTAGSWYTIFDEYHFCIPLDTKTKKAYCKQTHSILTPASHTLGRNTGNIGFSICALAKGFDIQPDQIEVLSKSVAEFTIKYKIDPDGVHIAQKKTCVGKRLVDVQGTIEVPNITDHKWYAEHDGYKGWRIDIDTLLPIVKTKIKWYRAKLVSGEQEFEHILNPW